MLSLQQCAIVVAAVCDCILRCDAVVVQFGVAAESESGGRVS